MKEHNSEYANYVKEQLNTNQWNRLIAYEKKTGHELNLDLNHFQEVILQASDLEKRIEVEIPFILDKLFRNYSGIPFNKSIDYMQTQDPATTRDILGKRYFDSCLGSGATTIGLMECGAGNLISNDIDEYLIQHSRKTAKSRGIDLVVTKCDWRELDKTFADNSFDVITNTGNSLTYLFKKSDQYKTLENFYKLLDHDGILIIDRRNYDQIIKGNFNNEGRGPYQGLKNIIIKPLLAEKDMVIMQYGIPGYNCNLVLYPFKDGEIEEILSTVGFKDIKIFGDYKEQYDPKEVEFYTYVARK
jgi:SAM-dependent methyltransferase